MSEIEKRARELLAAEYERYGDPIGAERARKQFPATGVTLRAIIAALTPPEGYVLIKADTLADLANDAEALIVQTEFRRDRIDGKLASVREARAMLTARPEVAGG